MAYKPQAGPTMSAPNVIPMADIMLVLLIIFMVVTPMLRRACRWIWRACQIPRICPMRKGRCDHRGRHPRRKHFPRKRQDVTGWAANKVRDLISNRLDKTVYIRADGRAKYGDVANAVDEIRSAGVDKVGMETERIERSNAPPPPPSSD